MLNKLTYIMDIILALYVIDYDTPPFYINRYILTDTGVYYRTMTILAIIVLSLNVICLVKRFIEKRIELNEDRAMLDYFKTKGA